MHNATSPVSALRAVYGACRVYGSRASTAQRTPRLCLGLPAHTCIRMASHDALLSFGAELRPSLGALLVRSSGEGSPFVSHSSACSPCSSPSSRLEYVRGPLPTTASVRAQSFCHVVILYYSKCCRKNASVCFSLWGSFGIRRLWTGFQVHSRISLPRGSHIQKGVIKLIYSGPMTSLIALDYKSRLSARSRKIDSLSPGSRSRSRYRSRSRLAI